jgi:hypothetical protein
MNAGKAGVMPPYDVGVAVRGELDALQVLLHDLSEDMLTVAHNDKTHNVLTVV